MHLFSNVLILMTLH